MVINASSAGFDGENLSEIRINGEKVLMSANESGNMRGLHIAVVNPADGQVV